MILLQTVLVSPETHLVKNLESLSTNEFQSKKTRSHKCNSLLKLKYSPSIAGLHVM